MFKLWPKKKQSNSSPNNDSSVPAESTPATGELTWEAQAQTGLDQAMSQAPVPAMLKGKVRRELANAAEAAARAAGRNVVTAEDLMNGLLAKLPSNMRSQVEEAMKGGPDKLKELEKNLKKDIPS